MRERLCQEGKISFADKLAFPNFEQLSLRIEFAVYEIHDEASFIHITLDKTGFFMLFPKYPHMI